MIRLRIAMMATLASFAAAGLSAAPAPLEPGWSVRLVTGSLGHMMNGIAYDPVTTDLFLTADHGRQLHRVTQAGAATLIHSDASFVLDALAFDPGSRRLYVGGAGQTTVRELDEFGALIASIAVGQRVHGLAIGPGGALHLNFTDLGEIHRHAGGTFPLHAGGLCTPLDGLAFDGGGDGFAAEPGCDRVERVAAGGSPVTLAGVIAPRGVTVGMGSAFVTAFDGTVTRMAADGSEVTAFAGGFDAALGIHFAANGRLYVADFNTSELWEFRPDVTAAGRSSWGRLKILYRP
jgi:hypothetical protein